MRCLPKTIILAGILCVFSSFARANDPAPVIGTAGTDSIAHSNPAAPANAPLDSMNFVPVAQEDSAASVHRGQVTFVEGRAKKQPVLTEDWLNAEKGSEIITGDKVRTLRDSRAELALMELDIIRLAPLTTIDIVKLYEETKEGRDETQINVNQGNIWALVRKVEETADFNISTPVAGAAITGTRFRVDVGEDSSTVLKVYEGEVRVTNAPGRKDLMPKELPQQGRQQIEGPKQVQGPRQVTFEEWYYIVKNMQEIRIAKNGQLLSSGSFSANDPEEQTAWVQWNLARDNELRK